MSAPCRLELTGSVARITLDSPGNANALTPELVEQLTLLLREAGEQAEARAVVIGHSGRAFCSGFDLKALARGERPDRANLVGLLAAVTMLDKPVLCAIGGAVRGGGMGLVAAADLAVASPVASFGFSEVRLGVTPAIISVACARRMSSRSLSRYMLTAEVFGAPEALGAGLVTAVSGPEEGALEAEVSSLVAAILLAEPGAVARTKALLRTVPAMQPEAAAEYTALLSRQAFSSPEAAEGIAAFVEKRPAAWMRT